MSRDEGFAVMDVSTSVCDDPKFRRLAREYPDALSPAFVAYVALMAESWKTGHRAMLTEAWPLILPYLEDAATALHKVGLIDKTGRIPAKTWAGWFEPAAKRRRQARDRWTRYNAQRTGDTASLPRGNDVTTATSVRPSVPSVRPSVPSVRPSARNGAMKTPQEAGTTRGSEPVSFKQAVADAGYVPASALDKEGA